MKSIERECDQTHMRQHVDFRGAGTDLVTVRACHGDIGQTDRAAAAGLVHHAHRLWQVLLGGIGKGARDEVGAAAGRERHDQFNLLAGVGRRVGHSAEKHRGCAERRQQIG